MGRPKSYGRKSISLGKPSDPARRFVERLEKTGWNVSSFIRKLIRCYVLDNAKSHELKKRMLEIEIEELKVKINLDRIRLEKASQELAELEKI